MCLDDRFLFLIGNEACRRGWDCIGNLSWRVLFLRLARDKEQVKLRFEFYRVVLDGRSSFVFSICEEHKRDKSKFTSSSV